MQLKELFAALKTPIVIAGPAAISTDCDQALRNTIATVFPESPALLCSWHANKNIQQQCRPEITATEDWERFIQGWNDIVRSKTEEEYTTRLASFETNFSQYSTSVEYVKKTWLRDERKKALVAAWTNQYPHFGITVTSRVEAAHRLLKRYIPDSFGDLLDTWKAIQRAVEASMRTLLMKEAGDAIRNDLSLNQRMYGTCFSTITMVALREVRNHVATVKHPLGPCTGSLPKRWDCLVPTHLMIGKSVVLGLRLTTSTGTGGGIVIWQN